jgi:pyridoxal 5'-phosphate synthase pdxT subunit
VRQGRLLATAFHPELTDDRRLHRLLVDLLDEAAAGEATGRSQAPA